jgi:hypothetical protein
MGSSFRFCVLLVLSAVLFVTAAGAGEAVRVVPPAALVNPRQPQAAIDPEGAIYVTYAAGETIYCSAKDEGKTFGEPVKVGELRKLALGMRRGPRVAAGDGFVVITAIGHEAGDLLAWRSTDGGQSWQGPIPVSDSPKDAREGLHAMAAGPRGQLYCVWLDCRDQKKGNRIFGSGSSDGGQTWTENRQVYASPSGTVCECCHPSVAFDSAGGLYAMWRNSLDGNRDLYLAASTNGGKSFGSAAKLGRGSWKLEGCPMDGGALAVMAPGKVTTIWRRQKEIYRTDAADQAERLLGAGEQPWAAASAEGPLLVWVSRRGGDLFLSKPKAERPIKLAEAATDPMIVAPLTGQGPAIVVWETGQAKNTSIMAMPVER